MNPAHTFTRALGTLAFVAIMAISMAGCNQVQEAYQKTAQEAENLKTQVVETKNKVEEKLNQAKEAADAVKKLTE